MDEMFEKGLRIRKEVMGSEHVDARLRASTEFTDPLQHMISRWAYGELWGREHIPRRTRSLLVLAMMAVLHRPVELRLHVKGALNNGCTVDEIRETLLTVAIYAGIPASVDAHDIAKEAIADWQRTR